MERLNPKGYRSLHHWHEQKSIIYGVVSMKWCTAKKKSVEPILDYRLIATYILVHILYQNVSGKSIENQDLIRDALFMLW